MAGNDKVPELNAGEFNDFIGKGNVLIDFSAEWCMPCVMMDPIIDDLSEKFEGKIKFGKVNIDGNQELARKFNVSSIPNFILFKDGKQIHQFVGSTSAENFEGKLNEFL